MRLNKLDLQVTVVASPFCRLLVQVVVVKGNSLGDIFDCRAASVPHQWGAVRSCVKDN